MRAVRLLVLLVALCASQAMAGAPAVLFKEGNVVMTANEIDVQEGLVQLELAPGLVASARSGTHFTLAGDTDGTRELVVFTGVVNLVDTRGAGVAELIAGRYELRFGERLDVSTPWGAGGLGEERRGFLLSDVGWARQNEVLQIPTQPLVQGIFGAINPVLRSLFGRPQR